MFSCPFVATATAARELELDDDDDGGPATDRKP
jgi:hypothetical protein